MRLLPPDDAADLVQAAAARPSATGSLALLDDTTRREVTALLAYAEDEAGGLMNPRFARVRPDATVDEAISYLRRQARERDAEAIYYAYVLDEEQRLLGVVSFRDLFAAPPEKRVRDVMQDGRRLGERGHGPGGRLARVRGAATSTPSRWWTPRGG